MNTILATHELTKKYGKFTAASKINIEIEKGSIYGLIGQNGAGKTTILRMLSGLARPTSGEIIIDGVSAQDKKMRIGALIEEPGVFPHLSASENLHLKAITMGVENTRKEKELLELVGLGTVGKKPVKGFSLGMRQRLGIALALVGDPQIVLLDEPINGLDPQGIIEIRELILKLNRDRGLTIIISSHLLEELSRMATSYGFIAHGRLVAQFSQEDLQARSSSRLIMEVSDVHKALGILNSLEITELKQVNEHTLVATNGFESLDKISIELAREGIALTRLSMESEDSESFYIGLVGGKLDA